MTFCESPRNTKRHKPIFKEMTTPTTRKRVGGTIRVQGQGYSRTSDRDTIESGAASSIQTMASNVLPVDSETEGEEDATPVMVEELVDINRILEKQIETLRLRLEFDTRHHDAEKHAIFSETSAKLKSKAEEINILKQQIHVKDGTIKTISKDNEKRGGEIHELKRQINSLNDEVASAKAYANDLVSELSTLTREREQLEREGVFGEKEKEVSALRKEVSDLKLNLTTLECELAKAREAMSSQTNKLKFADNEKKSLQLKFKEELARVSHSMRLEVEKMRDVMKKQWEEMRSLREQNFSMSKDIKDIRSLLVHGCLDDDAKMEQQQQQQQPQQQPQQQEQLGQGQLPQQIHVPQTARGGKQVNGFNMGALKPSLPVLNKDKKSSQRRK